MELESLSTSTTRIPSNLKKNISNEFTYDRDFLLNLLNLDNDHVISHLPEDLDTSLKCFISPDVENRLPLAHLPLSEIEKKLLSMLSINSDMGRRNFTAGASGGGGDRTKHHGVREHGYNRARPPREDRRPKEIKSDDLWDISPAGAPQGFGADGVFGVVSPGSSITRKDDDRTPVSQRNAWSVLADDEASSGNRPSPPQKPLDLGSIGFDGRSVFSDPFASTAVSGGGFSNLLQQQSFQQHANQVINPLSQHHPLSNTTTNIPGFTFTPPQWVYEDPLRRLQGPFTSEQMHGWYKEGYFPLGLPIKCVGDASFVPLKQIVDRYGSDAPFLNALVEQEALEIQFFHQQQQQQQLLQPSTFLRGFPQQSGLVSSNVPPIGQGIQAHHGRTTSSSPPIPTSENQAFLNFMSQKQKMEESVVGAVKPVEIQGPVPTSTTTTVSQSSVSEIRSTSEKRGKSPGKRPISPSDRPAVAILNKEIKKMHVSDPTVVSSSTPAEQAADSVPVVAPEVNDVKRDEGKKRGKGPAKRVSQAQAEAAVSTTSPVTSPSSSVVVEQSESGKSGQSVPVSVKKTTPAPWAMKPVPSGPPAAKVSEIQEKEEADFKVREKKEQEKAQARVIAEASALKKEAAASAVSGSLPGQWASVTKSNVPVTTSTKKTLAQIMEDEAKLKATVSNSPAANVSKGYAASVAANTSSLPPPKSFAAKASANVKVASGPVVKPTAVVVSSASGAATNVSSGNDGWSVVGGKSSSHVSSNATANANANASVNAKSAVPKKKEGGVSDSFKAWYRKALLPVSKATSLNVEEFVSILLSVSIKETGTISMICDDALFSAIDSRKFANEFCARRKADLEGIVYIAPVHGENGVNEHGWNVVPSKNTINTNGTNLSSSQDGFEVVGKKKKGKK